MRTSPTSLGNKDKETNLYETNHLRTDEWTFPYLTPNLTSSPPATLLAIAIRDATSYKGKEANAYNEVKEFSPYFTSLKFSC